MTKLETKIAAMTTEALVRVVKGLEDVFGVEADLVFETAMTALEARLPEDKFVALCEAL